MPDFLQNINLKYVKLGYHYLVTHFLTLLLVPLAAAIAVEASRASPDDVRRLWLRLHRHPRA